MAQTESSTWIAAAAAAAVRLAAEAGAEVDDLLEHAEGLSLNRLAAQITRLEQSSDGIEVATDLAGLLWAECEDVPTIATILEEPATQAALEAVAEARRVAAVRLSVGTRPDREGGQPAARPQQDGHDGRHGHRATPENGHPGAVSASPQPLAPGGVPAGPAPQVPTPLDSPVDASPLQAAPDRAATNPADPERIAPVAGPTTAPLLPGAPVAVSRLADPRSPGPVAAYGSGRRGGPGAVVSAATSAVVFVGRKLRRA